MPHLGQHYRFDWLFQDESTGRAEKFGDILVCQIGEMRCVNGYSVPEHSQWCHEISYVISGEGVFTTNNTSEHLMEGDIHFSPKGATHSITTSNGDLRFGYIGFSFEEASQDEDVAQLKAFFEDTRGAFWGHCPEFFGSFFGTLDELHNESPYSRRMVATYLIQMLIMAQRTLSKFQRTTYFGNVQNDSISRAVCLACEYIEKHIYDKIVIRDVSSAIGYNYSYLSDVFKKDLGVTISEYITEKKVQKAIELMKFENLSFTDVARKLNYGSAQSFNKVFKRITGYSPSAFMAANKAK